jgi:hypothetical protein
MTHANMGGLPAGTGAAELVERAFANDARTNSRTKGSHTEQHSEAPNPHQSA